MPYPSFPSFPDIIQKTFLENYLLTNNGYISKPLFDALFNDGIHLVTGIRSNMKNDLMPLRDKILRRKRSVIETINDELKNICHVEHSRHKGTQILL